MSEVRRIVLILLFIPALVLVVFFGLIGMALNVVIAILSLLESVAATCVDKISEDYTYLSGKHDTTE